MADASQIVESPQQLRQRESRTHDTAKRAPITMLRLMQQYPALPLKDIAAIIGCSERTAGRWWKLYREKGIDALPGNGVAGPTNNGDGRIQQLRENLIAGNIDSVKRIVQWLIVHATQEEKESLALLLQREMAATASIPRSARIVEFLNALPQTLDITQWMEKTRNALLRFLPEVDRISLYVNRQCDLTTPGQYRPGIAVMQQTSPVPHPVTTSRHDMRQEESQQHVQRQLESFRQQDFPFALYQEPESFVYYYHDTAYLGIIILWKEQGCPPISVETLKLMRWLEPFLEFLLSDAVVRFRYADPVGANYINALERLTQRFGLTPQEQQIVIQLSEGHSHKQIADILSVSINTVRTHLKSIYRKTGVQSSEELFARYLTPSGTPK